LSTVGLVGISFSLHGDMALFLPLGRAGPSIAHG
jgi:hypothetical protein